MKTKRTFFSLLVALISSTLVFAQGIDKEAYKHYINPELYGQYLDGFVVTKDYERIETKIKYEYPTYYQNARHAVITLNEKGKEKKFDKSELVGFGVDDQVYVPEMFGGKIMWLLLHREGAVQSTIFFHPEGGHPAEYYTVNHIVTHNIKEESLYVGHLAVNFNLKMSKLIEDYEDLATKVMAKEEGYHFVNISKILALYNLWYNEQHPGKVHYILPMPDYESIIANDVGRLIKEEN